MPSQSEPELKAPEPEPQSTPEPEPEAPEPEPKFEEPEVEDSDSEPEEEEEEEEEDCLEHKIYKTSLDLNDLKFKLRDLRAQLDEDRRQEKKEKEEQNRVLNEERFGVHAPEWGVLGMNGFHRICLALVAFLGIKTVGGGLASGLRNLQLLMITFAVVGAGYVIKEVIKLPLQVVGLLGIRLLGLPV